MLRLSRRARSQQPRWRGSERSLVAVVMDGEMLCILYNLDLRSGVASCRHPSWVLLFPRLQRSDPVSRPSQQQEDAVAPQQTCRGVDTSLG